MIEGSAFQPRTFSPSDPLPCPIGLPVPSASHGVYLRTGLELARLSLGSDLWAGIGLGQARKVESVANPGADLPANPQRRDLQHLHLIMVISTLPGAVELFLRRGVEQFGSSLGS